MALLVSEGCVAARAILIWVAQSHGVDQAWIAAESHAWVCGLAAAGICIDLDGLCYHRGLYEPCVMKSECPAEPAPPFTGPG